MIKHGAGGGGTHYSSVVAWSSAGLAAQPFLSHSTPVDVNNREMMLKIIKSAINTKADVAA